MTTPRHITRQGTAALRALAFAACAWAPTLAAHASGAAAGGPAYPAHPITIIVPNAPGSATDTLARMVAEGLNNAWKQPVIVDNKPGAQGIIGVQSMKKTSPDGYSLIVSFSGLNSSNPWLQKEPKYHYKDDFTHIVPLVRAPSLLLVHADSPYHTLDDLVAAARHNPTGMMYGYGQATSQVMGSAFTQAAGVPDITGIPYRGQPQALTDLAGRHFDFMFADLSVSKAFVESGKLRALGISTKDRSTLMPDVPTLHEQGIPDYDLAAWVGISGPAGMPDGIVRQLNTEITRFFATPASQERIHGLGFTALQADPDAFSAFVDQEYDRWGQAIRAANIPPQ